MTPDLARRLLDLPSDVRAALATVPGPGILEWGDGEGPTLMRSPPTAALGDAAWWSANPAASVAVVLDYDLRRAHERIADWLDAWGGDDHAAALSLIEAHVASRSSRAD